jgi:hypothetical protein
VNTAPDISGRENILLILWLFTLSCREPVNLEIRLKKDQKVGKMLKLKLFLAAAKTVPRQPT